METNPTGVYAEALGLCWRDLDDALRRLHGIDPVAAAGIFRIQHGNLLTRLIAWSARLPSTSDGAKLQLTIVPDGNCQKWRRDFAGRLLLSTQWKYADAIVAERVGIIEVHLHLEVVDGALHHRAVSARLRLGRMLVPIPRWLSPRITALEEPAGDRIAVKVEATLPFLGLLIAYEGAITISEGYP